MNCAFDLAHYQELIETARAAGYRFAFFGGAPQSGDVFLRHDVDLSLDAAVTMAQLEHQLGVNSTYFLMTESVFYNLASPAGERTIERLRGLGHAVGLHAVYPRAERDERFDALVAWHNPDLEYMSEPVEGAINVMEERYFSPEHYRSDSNQHWRHGCPHEELAMAAFDWLQLLTHPEIWVYSGASMRETMLAMLEADKQHRLDELALDWIDLS